MYKLLTDSKINLSAVAGTIVYACRGPDYGLAGDDTRHTGVPHRSVTLNPDGDYPCFTHPIREMKNV